MIWKRLSVLVAAAAMLFSSCEPEGADGIELNQDTVTLNASGVRVRLDFIAPGEWTASVADPSWCSITPDGGRAGDAAIMVSAVANELPDQRASELSITCGKSVAKVQVIQQAAGMVRISPQEIHAPAEGGTFDIKVEYNIDYSTIVGPTATDWVSVTPGTKGLTTGKISITVSPNESGWGRSGNVVVTSDAGDLSVVINQDGADIFTLSPMSQDIPGTGGTFTVNVSGSRPYHISTKPDWINEISVEGRTHTFEVPANYGTEDRSDYIVFCDDGGVCLPFEVHQDWLPSWAAQNFKHTSLVMRFTATWCGWCPRMNKSVQRAQYNYSGKLQHLALHGTSSSLYFAPTATLMDQYNVAGYPTGVVDGRIQIQNGDISATAQQIINASKETENEYGTVSGASVMSSLSGSKLKMNVTLYLRDPGDYKVTVLLIEDDIDAAQEDFEAEYHQHYTHNGVARAAVTSISGDEFTMEKGFRTKDFSYEATLNSKWKTDNVRILVYVQAQYGSRKKIRSGNYGDYYIDNCFVATPGVPLTLETE